MVRKTLPHIGLYLIAIIGLALLISCKDEPKVLSMEIIELADLNRIDTVQLAGEFPISAEHYYVVKGMGDYRDSETLLDQFVCENYATTNEYRGLSVVFYRWSKKTNPTSLKQNPNVLDRHSNTKDIICSYRWINGKFSQKQVYNYQRYPEEALKLDPCAAKH